MKIMIMLIFMRKAWMYPYMMTMKTNIMMKTIIHTVTDRNEDSAVRRGRDMLLAKS